MQREGQVNRKKDRETERRRAEETQGKRIVSVDGSSVEAGSQFLGRQLWLRFEQEVEIGVHGKTGGDVPIRAVRLLSWILMEHHEARNTAVLN